MAVCVATTQVGRGFQATELLRKAPSLVDVSIPAESSFTVCGDVHGQFYDLLHIFELNGLPSEENPYLFNGAPLRSSALRVYKRSVIQTAAWAGRTPRVCMLASVCVRMHTGA